MKTTADIQRFKTAYYDYRYHVQDAFYSDGYEAQFGVQPTFVFLVASTTIECGRYPVEIFMMGEEAKTGRSAGISPHICEPWLTALNTR